MPRLCEPCRRHAADDSASACAACGGPLKFTLLAAPGEDAAPMAGVAATHEELYGKPVSLADFFQGKRPYLIGGGLLSFVALIALMVWVRGGTVDEQVARIHVGMSATEVMLIVNGDRPKPKKWKIELGATSHKEPMPDFDRDVDVSVEESYVDYIRGDKCIRFHFSKGVVSRIEHRQAEHGLRKRVVVETR